MIHCVAEFHKKTDKGHNMSRQAREDLLIAASKAKYGPDRFDYTPLVGNFVNQNTKIQLKCRTHDVTFSVAPTNHLKPNAVGGGCPDCRSENVGNAKRKATTVSKAGECSSCRNKCEKKTCDACREKSHQDRLIREGLTDVCGHEGCINHVHSGEMFCGRHKNKDEKADDEDEEEGEEDDEKADDEDEEEGADEEKAGEKDGESDGEKDDEANEKDDKGKEDKGKEEADGNERKAARKTKVKCSYGECTKKAQDGIKWCGKHKRNGQKEEDIANGIRPLPELRSRLRQHFARGLHKEDV